jgi:hypothetical protein
MTSNTTFDRAAFERNLASALQDGGAVQRSLDPVPDPNPMPAEVVVKDAPVYRWSLVPTRDANTGLIVSVDLMPIERIHVP